jgi:hypothetical protein
MTHDVITTGLWKKEVGLSMKYYKIKNYGHGIDGIIVFITCNILHTDRYNECFIATYASNTLMETLLNHPIGFHRMLLKHTEMEPYEVL